MEFEAYWISPRGKIVPVPFHHIDLIIDNPELFGLTSAKIDAVYKKFKEPLHLEGYAREEIMAGLIKKGWVRVRYDARQDSFKLQVHNLSLPITRHIRKWAVIIIKGQEKVSPKTGFVLKGIREGGNELSGTLSDIVKARITPR